MKSPTLVIDVTQDNLAVCPVVIIVDLVLQFTVDLLADSHRADSGSKLEPWNCY